MRMSSGVAVGDAYRKSEEFLTFLLKDLDIPGKLNYLCNCKNTHKYIIHLIYKDIVYVKTKNI